MISFQVVAHPNRAESALSLAERVGADIAWEDGSGIWATHMKAFRQGYESGADYVCVLEDDALPVDGFLDAVQKAVDARPEHLISLYLGTGRPLPDETLAHAVRRAGGLSWMEHRMLLWGVGVVIPAGDIPALLEYTPRHCGRAYDNELSRFWHTVSPSRIQYTWPSLVDHFDGDSISSPGVKVIRKALRVGVPDTWDTGSAKLG